MAMTSDAQQKISYVPPAEPKVIGSAAAAENGPFSGVFSFDGGGFPDAYGS